MGNPFGTIINELAKSRAEAADQIVSNLLERNGIVVNTRNERELEKLLADNGYMLHRKENSKATKVTYELYKLIDDTSYEFKYTIGIDSSETNDKVEKHEE